MIKQKKQKKTTAEEILAMNNAELVEYYKGLVRNIQCNNCPNCNHCMRCSNCDNCICCTGCDDCTYSLYLGDCRHCYLCNHLYRNEYYICNVSVTKEEYENKIKEITID